MQANKLKALSVALAIALGGAAMSAGAAVYVQCPGDTNGDAIPDGAYDPNKLKCMHLTGGDGFVTMADGTQQYIFGFNDVTGVPEANVMNTGMLAANFPAPTIVLKQGQEFYLSLTNVGMVMRPDLFDPHTVHFHGFPNAATVFDGVPDASLAINMGSTFTYYYNLVEPGTYMYHCHVEATEHMQMGMLGNLYVLPIQDELPAGTTFGNGFVHQAGYKYVYNDADGSTRYDVEYPIQIGSFDPDFHAADLNIQPLPFAAMHDRYPMLNGRGYPDTLNPNPLPAPADNVNNGKQSQPVSSLITATVGQKILLRISNLNVTNFYTLTAAGLNMRVVGTGARLMHGPDPDGAGPLVGKDTSFDTMSVTLGGGEGVDVIIDTTAVTPGTYFLYTTNLNYLSNDAEDYGGMMTEIHINPLI
ncbi:MAG TPA: multicopper oxidase domain-containing protein [Gammaproteobacteria bacterium]